MWGSSPRSRSSKSWRGLHWGSPRRRRPESRRRKAARSRRKPRRAMPERLQKLLMRAGAVRVNGRVARLGEKADPERDRIELEGRLLRFPQRHVYFLLNKPRNTVCTASDPRGRPTVFHLLKGVRTRCK